MLFHFAFDFLPLVHRTAFSQVTCYFFPFSCIYFFCLEFLTSFVAIQDTSDYVTTHFAVSSYNGAASFTSTQLAFLFRAWHVATASNSKE